MNGILSHALAVMSLSAGRPVHLASTSSSKNRLVWSVSVVKYPKIDTLWKRDDDGKIIRSISRPEFENIRYWHVTEKIDGTNIRILYNGSEPIFQGRTDKAVIPNLLLDHLKNVFTKELLSKTFPEAKNGIVLYGEGYGGKIQNGKKAYGIDESFILFDAWIDGWWLEPESVKKLAKDLGISYVPEFGIMSGLKLIEQYVKELKHGEGIVARSHPLMLFRNGDPVMFKLKVRDYARSRS